MILLLLDLVVIPIHSKCCLFGIISYAQLSKFCDCCSKIIFRPSIIIHENDFNILEDFTIAVEVLLQEDPYEGSLYEKKPLRQL